ncbi:hypothetical protein SCHPADRAFT_650413 [Schizopora paradoxa]|uniref:DUF6533 domain-containing protein n=1 Tax=Schizopora paradoxa TaxID=27342 RepID=A0A0H2R6E9_9AGAM|nr:hypothetical protein SCHPADRAFT_650413 [Schizopora paradoxa]
MDAIPPQILAGILTTAGNQILGTKYAILGLLTLNIYDHIMTLPQEIKYIWKRKFTAVSFLFFMNRYYALCVFIIGLIADSAPNFNFATCSRFALFQPLAGGIPLTIMPDMVIGLRVYALYGRNKLIAVLLANYLTAELGVALWLYLTPGGHPLNLPGPPDVMANPTLQSVEQNADKLGNLRSAAFQFMQTIYDTVVFIMIAYKTVREAFGPKKNRSIKTLMAAHGLVYYAVVLATNLAWALMIILAPVGLKYSLAAPTLILVCMSVNKMTLSLRSFGEPDGESFVPPALPSPPLPTPVSNKTSLKRRNSWIGTSTFEVPELVLELKSTGSFLDGDSFEVEFKEPSTSGSSGSETFFELTEVPRI